MAEAAAGPDLGEEEEEEEEGVVEGPAVEAFVVLSRRPGMSSFIASCCALIKELSSSWLSTDAQ